MAKSISELNELKEAEQRKSSDRRVKNCTTDASGNPIKERRTKNRRRQIDPTTCEREYTEPEVEFMRAMDDYKRSSGRMFPTCSEILEVLTKLGYRQLAPAEAGFLPTEAEVSGSL